MPSRQSWSNPEVYRTVKLQFTRFIGRVIDLIPRVDLKIPLMFGPLKMATRPARGLSSNQWPATLKYQRLRILKKSNFRFLDAITTSEAFISVRLSASSDSFGQNWSHIDYTHT